MGLKAFYPEWVLVEGKFRANHGVVVETASGRIAAVDAEPVLRRRHPRAAVSKWPGLAVVPGTVNSHTHSFQHLLRGLGSDAPFLAWRDAALYRTAPWLDAQAICTGARLAFSDMLLSGITTVADFFYVHRDGLENDRAVIQAAREVGIRLVFARCLYDWPGAPDAYRERVDDAVQRTRALAQEVQGDPLVSVHPAPHSLHGASDEMIAAGVRLAQELDTPYHMHVAEEPFEVAETRQRTGKTPVQYLAQLGALTSRLIAVHLVWLDAADIARLGQTRTRLAYCPSSNMFLADGVTPVVSLLKAGVLVGLGTDGGCSNNRASIFEEMRMAALLQKVTHLDATALSAEDVFAMGTGAGAEILESSAGRIAPGAWADFLAIDTSHLSLTPWTPEVLLNNLVYALQPEAIRHVVVGGRIVVRDRRLMLTPLGAIHGDAQALRAEWQSRGLAPSEAQTPS
ncbi:MAG: amidohydrolase family protein [Thermaerobacter sp.]|nr:amidohydrolase family protein [Thermaerobacter sp.]